MAAYAATVSLMHILDLIQNHPSPPISFDKRQLHSLTEIVTFLQEFLEGYVSPFSYSDEADPLELRIADAVYAAEDVIESYIVDKIHRAAATTTTFEDDATESYIVDCIQLLAAAALREYEQIRYINFYEGLQEVIEAMDLIKNEAIGMDREEAGVLQRNVSVDAGFKSSHIGSKSSVMVGFDDKILQLKEMLVGGDSDRRIIPIIGMGGIGKTTLARNVFADKLIVEHFDICLWATISQDYNIEQTLSEILSSQGRGNSGVKGLGEDLHKHLFGRRYLVVLDDMWSIEVWDKMRNFFPDCGEGSRVIVTTRMSNLAAHLTNSSNSLCMSFLNKVDSWTLFSQTVFKDEESLPDLEPELREIGESIVGKCKGLPLSIAVIGGLLARSERTQGYWEYVEGNLSSIVNLENEEYCLRVLKLSYNHLPAYLKPCFLYMGMFDEDSEIKVSKIIHLWVSEGFVKPKKKQNLERVAREYFQELVDRSLVMVVALSSCYREKFEVGHKLGWVGDNIKWCKMHDLVRDLSLREAQKQRFYHVYTKQNCSSILPHRRIVIPDKNLWGVYRPLITLEPSSVPRSYVCHNHGVGILVNFRLLRTLSSYEQNYASQHEYRRDDVFGLVNARLLAITVERDKWGHHDLHSSISRLWSLHTLIVYSPNVNLEAPDEFWNMHQLKHVEFTSGRLRLQLPNKDHIVILENLHTLIGVVDFHLNEDAVRRMPNLNTLDIRYEVKMNSEFHCLSYLHHLSKLESLRYSVVQGTGQKLERICFPPSLKQIDFEDLSNLVLDGSVLTKIGRLALVEDLSIGFGVFRRGKWETTEGQFPRLKKLELAACGGLKKWIVSEASHFPLLEKITLVSLKKLEEVPSEIGEIATLKSIDLTYCSRSAVLSAKKIVEEQEDLYGEDQLSFRVQVICDGDALLKSLETPNFQVLL